LRAYFILRFEDQNSLSCCFVSISIGLRPSRPRALGTEEVYTAPPQTRALSLRAAEEWERCICENQAFSILHQAQEGRQELIKKDGGEMLMSIVLDRPLDEAKALVEDPDRLISAITAIFESKQAHHCLIKYPRRSRPSSAQRKTVPTVTPCQTTRP